MKKKIIVLCTGNSCRSIMTEALLSDLAGESFEVVSAGSKPAGYVHPRALNTLRKNTISIGDFRSKSWDEYEGQEFDIILTVCDSAAEESCPYFSGRATRIHWSIPDPAQAKGADIEVEAEFQRVFDLLKDRVETEFL